MINMCQVEQPNDPQVNERLFLNNIDMWTDSVTGMAEEIVQQVIMEMDLVDFIARIQKIFTVSSHLHLCALLLLI